MKKLLPTIIVLAISTFCFSQKVNLLVHEGHTDEVNDEFQISKNGLLLTSAHDKSWILWDLKKNISIIKFGIGDNYYLYNLYLEPNGEFVLIEDGNLNSIKIWDIRSRTYSKTFENIYYLKFTGRDFIIAYKNGDQFILNKSDYSLSQLPKPFKLFSYDDQSSLIILQEETQKGERQFAIFDIQKDSIISRLDSSYNNDSDIESFFSPNQNKLILRITNESESQSTYLNYDISTGAITQSVKAPEQSKVVWDKNHNPQLIFDEYNGPIDFFAGVQILDILNESKTQLIPKPTSNYIPEEEWLIRDFRCDEFYYNSKHNKGIFRNQENNSIIYDFEKMKVALYSDEILRWSIDNSYVKFTYNDSIFVLSAASLDTVFRVKQFNPNNNLYFINRNNEIYYSSNNSILFQDLINNRITKKLSGNDFQILNIIESHHSEIEIEYQNNTERWSMKKGETTLYINGTRKTKQEKLVGNDLFLFNNKLSSRNNITLDVKNEIDLESVPKFFISNEFQSITWRPIHPSGYDDFKKSEIILYDSLLNKTKSNNNLPSRIQKVDGNYYILFDYVPWIEYGSNPLFIDSLLVYNSDLNLSHTIKWPNLEKKNTTINSFLSVDESLIIEYYNDGLHFVKTNDGSLIHGFKNLIIDKKLYQTDLSHDKNKIILFTKDSLYIYDIKGNVKLVEQKINHKDIIDILWSPDDQKIAILSKNEQVQIYSVKNWKHINSKQVIEISKSKPFFQWSANSKEILTNYKNNLTIYDIKGKVKFNHELKEQWHRDDILIQNTDDFNSIYCANKKLHEIFYIKNRVQFNYTELNEFEPMTINWTNNRLISSFNSSFCISDLLKGENIAYITIVDSLENIIRTADNYYKSTKKAAESVYFTLGDKQFEFTQFDLKYNRPDIILDRLGYADSSLVNAYHSAYLKRLKKMNFTEDMLEDDFHLPEIKIENFEEMPILEDQGSIDVKLKIEDTKYNLDRINIWVNDVAVYGSDGISLRDKNVKNYSTTLSVNLAKGKNKVQVSVLNQAGAESYKETFEIESTAGKSKPDLYLITIGESKFKQAEFDLTYAAKDAEDMATLFQKSKAYANVFTKTLTNEGASKDSILSLKSFLAKADINDQVMIFIAGHGVLDADLDYYFATHEMDFSNPKEKGLAYKDLESLLDGIKPLKKTLIIDACHSGEIDKDEMELAVATSEEVVDVKFRNVGTTAQPKLGMQNTMELTKSLFIDLRKGTGATVISSAGGMEYAMESGEWKNGLFTYVLINGVKSGNADLNKDGEIWLSELQQYVGEEVSNLSNGQQQPTNRIENQSVDFRVW